MIKLMDLLLEAQAEQPVKAVPYNQLPPDQQQIYRQALAYLKSLPATSAQPANEGMLDEGVVDYLKKLGVTAPIS